MALVPLPSSFGRKPDKVGDVIPFAKVANVLEQVSKMSKNNDKNIKINNFINKCREHFKLVHGTLNVDEAGGDSLFPIIRILLPSLDRSRQAYKLQTRTLGRLMADVLNLNSVDRAKLVNWKDPAAVGDGVRAGDFASFVYSILSSRMSSVKESNMSITGLNEILDKIGRGRAGESTEVTQDDQKKLLLELFTKRKISCLEAKWVVRLLLKNLEFGVSKNKILECIHPKARQMLTTMHDLEEVCLRCNDPEAPVDIDGIKMFYYVKPMLCLRIVTFDIFEKNKPSISSLQDSAAPTSRRQQQKMKVDLTTYMEPPYHVEIKYDGERFQVHYDGQRWKYISKAGHDYSNSFNGTLTPRLEPQLQHGVQSFIIDCEMMAWHKENKVFAHKGGQVDVKTLRVDNPKHCPMLIVFDILFYNDEVVIDKPLSGRSELARSIFKDKDGVVWSPKPRILQTREQVEQALNDCIDKLDEGLVIKSLGKESAYKPGYRGLDWRKVKPEFLSGTSITDLDLLILGAYFSEKSRRGGTISNFLVGVIDQSDGKETFYPITRVGPGHLAGDQLKNFIEQLKPNLGTKEYPNVNYEGRPRPDLFIDPTKSIVVQVKASEIVDNFDLYVVKCTLRFPRITEVRRDKSYKECMTLQELHDLRESTKGLLAKKTDGGGSGFSRKRKPGEDEEDNTSDEDIPTVKRFGKTDPKSTIPSPSKSISPNKITQVPVPSYTKKPAVVKNVFKSKRYCVYGPKDIKEKLDNEIAMYGGDVVQNPLKNDKTYIVGGSESFRKIEQAIKLQKYDVIKADWITRCIKEGKELPLMPSDLFFFTDETAKLFEQDYDRYGDSWVTRITTEEAKDLIQKRVIPRLGKEEEDEESDDDNQSNTGSDFFDEIDDELFPDKRKINKHRFFRSVVAYFKGHSDPILSAKIEFYGGRVVEDEEDPGITHVIIKDPLSPRKKDKVSAFLVKPTWIIDSIRERKVLNEFKYSCGVMK